MIYHGLSRRRCSRRTPLQCNRVAPRSIGSLACAVFEVVSPSSGRRSQSVKANVRWALEPNRPTAQRPVRIEIAIGKELSCTWIATQRVDKPALGLRAFFGRLQRN